MTAEAARPKLRQLDPYRWEVVKEGGMRVPGLVYASGDLIKAIENDQSLVQVQNVAHLPGIVGCSIAMPDIHWGYGFPIGGVAATDPAEGGVISPGGVGYDICCGVRLARTNLTRAEIAPKLDRLVGELFNRVPTGVGASGAIRKLSVAEERRLTVNGARWAGELGYATDADLERTEESGRMAGADPAGLSERAIERGRNQVGTLGSGNHFLEVDVVERVFDSAIASAFGLEKGQIVVLIHCGSRGFGYQVCDDFLRVMERAARTYHISLPDRQLAAAPVRSPEGEAYIASMACAMNYAWTNRQMILHLAREAFGKALDISPRDLAMEMVYDVAHNIAKLEEHEINGERRRVLVHRKGATRSFPAGHPDVPEPYRAVGHPVLIPGEMLGGSYVCVGTEESMQETFGSSAHGAGRRMSRKAALKRAKGRAIDREMAAQGVQVRARGRRTLGEEMPEAYKDVSQVVDVIHNAGIARKVVHLKPIGVIKG